jgi:hypothetical protein
MAGGAFRSPDPAAPELRTALTHVQAVLVALGSAVTLVCRVVPGAPVDVGNPGAGTLKEHAVDLLWACLAKLAGQQGGDAAKLRTLAGRLAQRQ